MKIRSFTTSLTCLFLSAINTAFGGESPGVKDRLLARPHQIYIGPEFLSMQIDSQIKDAHVDGKKFFWGLKFGYEYLKPQSFYAAAELSAMNTSRNFPVTYGETSYKGKKGEGFGNIQARFGYTASHGRFLATPFLGLGVYSLSNRGSEGFEQSMGYVSGGLRTQFDWTTACQIGLNAELFRMLGVEQKAKCDDKRFKADGQDWGCKIETPLTIRLSEGWDVKVAPYYLRQLLSEKQNAYGSSLLFGYRF